MSKNREPAEEQGERDDKDRHAPALVGALVQTFGGQQRLRRQGEIDEMEHNARRLPDRDTQGKQRDHHQQAESDMAGEVGLIRGRISTSGQGEILSRPPRRAGANADRIQDAKRLNWRSLTESFAAPPSSSGAVSARSTPGSHPLGAGGRRASG